MHLDDIGTQARVARLTMNDQLEIRILTNHKLSYLDNPLTVDGIWVVGVGVDGLGWCYHPTLLQDVFVKNIGKLYAYTFKAMLLKFYLLTIKKISRYLEHILDSFQY